MLQVKTTKICSSCKTEKEISCFVSDKNRGDGIYPRCKSCRKEYYTRNFPHISAKMKEYNALNKARRVEWNKAHRKRRFFWSVAANLRVRSRGESATYQELGRLWKAQRGICPLSLRRLTQESAQLDHIIPHIRGGSSTIENLQWVDRDVNYAKRDLSDAEFIALCQEVTLANLTKQRS